MLFCNGRGVARVHSQCQCCIRTAAGAQSRANSQCVSIFLNVVACWPPRQGPWVIHMATTAGPYIKREARLLLCFRIIPQEGFELKSAL